MKTIEVRREDGYGTEEENYLNEFDSQVEKSL